jgi:DNA-binding beta-propeller fold protein YncE
VCVAVFHVACFAQETSQSNSPVQLPGLQSDLSILLPNGWSLNPQGKQIAVGDFPVNVQISPDGDYAAILHAGWGDHEVQIVSLESREIVSSARLVQAFAGLAFSPDGKHLAVSGGEQEIITLFAFADGFLGFPKTISVVDVQKTFVVAGMQWIGTDSDRLLVSGLLGNEVRIIDVNQGATIATIELPADTFPCELIIDSASNRAYVSLWGNASVQPIDLTNQTLLPKITTRSHPTELRLLDDGKRLLVACSDDNAVCCIDIASGKTLEIIKTSLFPNAPNGSTPMSLDVSPDGNVLAVANADNNNLALFNISDRGHSRSLGFIPVGWYPTNVKFSETGSELLVSNGKGLSSKSNRNGPNPNLNAPKEIREYIGGLFQGTLSIIDVPSPAEMTQMTKLAFASSPLEENNAVTQSAPEGNPIPAEVGDPSPIEHCVYIIKENRTYDQVFGDMPRGNGDSSLCIFPRNVTPNHHALADRFVLLDNFYVESEVSADGHEWTMAAYATDFVEKTWPLNYRRGLGKLKYPAEGKFPIAAPSSGYLWDKCAEKNVSYFSFGEFIQNANGPNAPATTQVEALQGHFDPQFRSYDLDYPDVRRADRFIERWNQFLAEGDLPQLMIVRLPNDHTYGTRVGKPTPTAMVADNDLALGRIVETISKSPVWGKTAIFVIQDDAQNGSDHVDAHRTVALAISPYTQHAQLDSTQYATSSMLRTMELILGLDPMTQFDAAATPMYRSFRSEPNLAEYSALQPGVDLKATNDATAWGAELSESLNLATEDAADDLLFGDIVWRSVKGADNPMPPPVRAAFVYPEIDDDDEDDEDDEDDDNEQARGDQPDDD